MKLVDSHSHLFLEEFKDDLPQVIARARAAGVTHVFMPNIDSTTIEPMLRVCKAYKGYCYPMIGLHPTSVNADYAQELEVVARELESSDEYVAIGEIGMDLYWDKTFLKEQEVALNKQIEWALQYDLPVVIHCREAFDLIYNVLKPYRSTALKGIFHSFTGTLEEACRIMEFPSFMIGINGVVTFKKSTLPEVLKGIPPERIVLETDAPYLTPVPNRGKRNESAYLRDTLMKVAQVYDCSPEKLAQLTSDAAFKIFGMLESPHEDFKVY
ncbi:TatD family hydrolase [Bacteroides zoogleoformans]|uniref:TatD family hydrolase n=1 Tax=Bacteroides zoogleoformans TaxID=28119 RepID=UPI00248D7562|nr:TatD family hydrolase [Bacteroides zoogleoformans]